MVLNRILVDRAERDLRWAGIAVWGAGWSLMLWLDGRMALGNLALILVLAGAIAGLWLSPVESMVFSAVSVGLFNFLFVNPRLSFVAWLHEDLLLLVTLLGVSTGISYLLARLRHLVSLERQHAIAREAALLNERAALDKAQDQHLRNTLLTAISHDYRTPLATMTSAASTLAAHAGALPAGRIADLSRTILNEAGHLNRITTNTLQLARLDGDAVRGEGVRLPVEQMAAEVRLGSESRQLPQGHRGQLPQHRTRGTTPPGG